MKCAAVVAYVAVATVSVTSALLGQTISQDTLPDNHFLFKLRPVNRGFQGGAKEYLAGFTVSLNFRHGTPEAPLNRPTLMKAIRGGEVTGLLTYPTGASTPIVYEVVRHRATDDIYMKTSLGYFLWESAVVRDEEVSFVIDWWYTPPVRTVDVDVVAMAERLLADSTHWDRRDDRQCKNERANHRWSLFCALKYASIETMGEYNHHNPAMNAVRLLIYELHPDPLYEHPLMDYNNADATTHDDILRLLARTKEGLNRAIQNRP